MYLQQRLVVLAAAFAMLVLSACSNSPVTPTMPNGLTSAEAVYTLSGVVATMTEAGLVRLEGLTVREARRQQAAITNKEGYYSIPGVPAGEAVIQIDSLTFVTYSRDVSVSGDVSLDILLEPRPTNILSGTVFEATATGRVPIENVQLYCDGCGSMFGHTFAYTDRNGSYAFAWTQNGVHPLLVNKAGYALRNPVGAALPGGTGTILAVVSGRTVFDIELVPR